MSAITSCPGCHTHFRVTSDQLDAKGGLVRCGRCQWVFNALDHLSAYPAPDLDLDEDIPEFETREEAQHLDLDEASADNDALEDIGDFLIYDPDQPHQEPAEFTDAGAATRALGKAAPAPESSAHARASFLFEEPVQPQRPRAPWIIANAALAIVLLAHGAYQFRGVIARAAPELRPTLEQVCDYLNCTVPLTQALAALNIESSGLEVENAQAGVYALHVNLRNQAPYPQALPYLELTLTDVKDGAIALRTFTPQEYLADATQARAPWAAQSELPVRVFLNLGELKPAGYRVRLGY